jgi:hypothetical protein
MDKKSACRRESVGQGEVGRGSSDALCAGASEVADLVNKPPHYLSHPSGIECIQITEHMGFNLGNAVKYLWRCDLKKDAIEDLEKAAWYINREIQKRKNEAARREDQT